MRKSTRPASGTSEPYSHILDTRYYKGVGGTMAVTETFFLGPYQGGNNPTDDDPRWEPEGGARPSCSMTAWVSHCKYSTCSHRFP